MQKRKIRIGVLFGGKSAEHEISLLSARNVIEGLSKDKYEVTLIGIDKQGHWCLCNEAEYLLHHDDPKKICMHGVQDNVSLITKESNPCLISLSKQNMDKPLDVIFPVLHGTYGEDGTIQGLLKLAGIPFVGAGVLGSAVGMDKDVMKRLLRDAKIPTAKFYTIHRKDMNKVSFEEIVRQVGLPFFIKPANLGSSVGISKVKSEKEWKYSLEHAFKYDHKVVIEEAIQGREIECSVLGNDAPIASLPGEVIPCHEFYSYEAKYLDDKGANFEIPAHLSEEEIKKVQQLAIAAYETLCCEGMARVDFFLQVNGEIKVNEINTIPGFTKISMYPKMWQASGLNYSRLLDRLVELALEKQSYTTMLKTTFE
ncbi:MAG: D-alanine--D-alanine ligase [Anaplasmataceae bacterium]|nr:D-alanine--D-alanine ligase [Anaplasmataceae bacterium]